MILAVFHIVGMMFLLRDRLNVFVRYRMATGPRYLRRLMFILSGQVKLFIVTFIAVIVWCVVSSFGVFGSLFIIRINFLFLLCVLCLIVCECLCLVSVWLVLNKAFLRCPIQQGCFMILTGERSYYYKVGLLRDDWLIVIFQNTFSL